MDVGLDSEDGFPPASGAAGDDDVPLDAFREWFSKNGGAARMRLLDSDSKYQQWLVVACPLVDGGVNVAQLSANTGLEVGYRAVSAFALVEKARQLSATRAWPAGKILRVWRSQCQAVGLRGAADAKPGAIGKEASDDAKTGAIGKEATDDAETSDAVEQGGAAAAKPGAIGKEASDDAKTGDASAEDALPAASMGPTSLVPPPPLAMPPPGTCEPPPPPSPTMAPMGTRLAYVSGHHRGCALHALFLFHHCTGRAPPEWLVRMGQHVPAHVESGMTAEAAAIKGLAATAQAQHGTTPTTYLDIVRVVGAGGACRSLSAEQVQAKLREEVPAFVERMAPEGWMRLGWVATRVCSAALDCLYEFADQWGSVPIPMKWWRDNWMLLPPLERGGGKVGESFDELAQTLLVRRLLVQVTELIQELLDKRDLERHEVASKLPGILCKARFNIERRKELRDLCVKYASGMGTAVKKHTLEATVVEEMHSEFCQGLADDELSDLTVPPALFWPSSLFVQRKRQEAEARESECLQVTLEQNLAQARDLVQAESVGHHAAESAGHHTAWKAECRLYTHKLTKFINTIGDEAMEIVKAMEHKRSEKFASAIGAHLQVDEVTFDSKSGSYRFGPQWASALGSESDACLVWYDLNFTVPKWDADLQLKQELKAVESILSKMGTKTILAVVAPLDGARGLEAEVAIGHAAQKGGHAIHRFHIILEGSADWSLVPITSLLLCGKSAAWGSNGEGTPCAIAERIMKSKAWSARACVRVPVLGPVSGKVRDAHRRPHMERQWGSGFYMRVFRELNLGLAQDGSGGPLIPGMKFLELDAGVGHACQVIADTIAAREEAAAAGDDSLRAALQGWLWIGGVPPRSPRKDVIDAICQSFGNRMAATDNLAAEEFQHSEVALENLAARLPALPQLVEAARQVEVAKAPGLAKEVAMAFSLHHQTKVFFERQRGHRFREQYILHLHHSLDFLPRQTVCP